MKNLTIILLLLIVSCGHIMSEEEVKEYNSRVNRVQTAVTVWIKEHALYPDSYKSDTFCDYSYSQMERSGEKIPNSESHTIKHTHHILDKDSVLKTFTGYFILGYDYSVELIEEKRSNAISAGSNLELNAWTDKFGKPNNKKDSLDQIEQQRKASRKFVKEMKDGLKTGVIYTGNPADEEKLNLLIDSLEKNR